MIGSEELAGLLDAAAAGDAVAVSALLSHCRKRAS
jgi:hypothetical protein